MILRIYNDNKKAWGVEKVKKFNFPDGQPHVVVPIVEGDSFAAIECSIRNPAELFDFQMVLETLERNSIAFYVRIFWLFGARMDRAIDFNQPSTFDCVMDGLNPFINSYARKIFGLLDIHNPTKVQGVDHLTTLVEEATSKSIKDFDEDCDIYFPDAGAEKRYESFFSNKNILVGQKKRDSNTGQLSGFELKSGEKKSKSILIVDDLCDGGGTFLGQYPVLKDLGYDYVSLYTTHGLYTKGLDILSKFDRVYSTNSFQFGQDEDNDELKLRVFKEGKQTNTIKLRS